MTPSSIFEVRFASPEEKYGLLNFHRSDELADIAAIVSGRRGGEHPVILLAGELGSGRRYLLEAALFEARQAGAKARLATIDLSGFEFDSGDVEKFALRQLAEYREPQESHWKELAAALAPAVSVSLAGIDLAALLSLSLSADLPFRKVLALLQRTAASLPGPERPPAEALDHLIAALCEDGRLVLHVRDSIELPAPFRRRLIRAAQRHPEVTLAFSCRSIDGNQKVAPDCESVRYELPPLDVFEIRQALDERFSPNGFDDEFCRLLRDISGGQPGRIALKMKDLITAGIVQYEAAGGWFLSGKMEAGELSKRLGASIQDAIDEAAAGLSEQRRQQMLGFLQAAALCGEYVPVALVARFTGVSEDDEDDFLDLADELFGEEGRFPLFRDWEFQHPSFPSVLIYSFRNRVYGEAILHHVSQQQRALQASRLLEALNRALPPSTRGIARTHLYLTYHLGSKETRRAYERELNWWVGQEDAAALRDFLSQSVRERRTDPKLLWNAAALTGGRWPAYRRLALLDAFREQPQGVPTDLLPFYRLARARLLHEAGRFREGLEEGLLGLELVESDALHAAAFHEVLGACHTNLGELPEAEKRLRQAVEIREAHLGGDVSPPDLAASLGNLADVLASARRYEEALRCCQRALELLQGDSAAPAAQIGQEWMRRGDILRRTGQLQEARAELEKAREVLEESLPEHHPRRAMALSRLAGLYLVERDFEALEEVLEQALPAATAAFGPQHPEYATLLIHQARLAKHHGKWRQALEGYVQASSIFEQAALPQHPQVGNLWIARAEAERELGHIAEAREAVAKGIEILANAGEWERDNLKAAVARGAKLLRETGDEAEARRIEQRFQEPAAAE